MTVVLLDRPKLKPKRALAAEASSITTPELHLHHDADGKRGTIARRLQTGLSEWKRRRTIKKVFPRPPQKLRVPYKHGNNEVLGIHVIIPAV